MKRLLLLFLLAFCALMPVRAKFLLIPMDDVQTDHLRAYGIAYSMLESGQEINWLLNYRGGSFLLPETEGNIDALLKKAVFFEKMKDEATADMLAEILHNPMMDARLLEKVPRIAVLGAVEDEVQWGDAVISVLDYAGIPYTLIYDGEVLDGELKNYDWLHVHHEDFTGQYGKFYASFRHQAWYKATVARSEATAEEYGFASVREMKLAVALSIRSFIHQGGFFFAMCSAADTWDIALAAENIDFVDEIFDGTPKRVDIQDKLNFNNSLAFENFEVVTDPMVYEHSNIDANVRRRVPRNEDFFDLADYSATEDVTTALLCQNHLRRIKGFLGQTTAFRKEFLKKGVEVMGELSEYAEARYIHGEYGQGAWTFLGGHDPEDYRHLIGEEATNVAEFRNSPGYRLILNNVLFPSARLNEDVPGVQKAELWPNPNQGRFELRFESKERQMLDISVYNVLHQEIFSSRLETNIGFNTLPINLGKVSKGIYFLELRKDDFALKRKVIVQ